MKNPKIAEILKEYRKLNHLSVKEVADYLHRNNVDIAGKTDRHSQVQVILCCSAVYIRSVMFLLPLAMIPISKNSLLFPGRIILLSLPIIPIRKCTKQSTSFWISIHRILQKSKRLKCMMQIISIILLHKFRQFSFYMVRHPKCK